MLDVPLLLVCIVIVALVFDYTNGAHDTGNVIATVVSTDALSPKAASTLWGQWWGIRWPRRLARASSILK